MNGLIKKHIQGKIRCKIDDIEVYNPTIEQKEEIRKILNQYTKVDSQLTIKGEIDLTIIKYLIKELTNIGKEVDSYSDKDLNNAFVNGDRVLKTLERQLVSIIEEVMEETQHEVHNMLIQMEKALELNESHHKMNQILKKMGVSSIQELSEISKNPEEFKKVINKAKPKGKKKNA